LKTCFGSVFSLATTPFWHGSVSAAIVDGFFLEKLRKNEEDAMNRDLSSG